jgi:hypothetical protein
MKNLQTFEQFVNESTTNEAIKFNPRDLDAGTFFDYIDSMDDETIEEYEVDMDKKPVRRAETQSKRPINENVSSEVINIDEKYLRKLIASELTKALPKIIENYFDSRLVKENVQFKAGNTIFSGTVMPMPKVKGKNNI